MNKREIKFRCWNGEQMVSPDYIDRSGTAWWKENSIPTTSENVMQYTGLKDNNGVEIYEADILKSHNPGFSEPDKYCAVKYSGSGFVVYNPNCCDICKTSFGCIANLDEYGDFEIIGNLYEHPHLINPAQ